MSGWTYLQAECVLTSAPGQLAAISHSSYHNMDHSADTVPPATKLISFQRLGVLWQLCRLGQITPAEVLRCLLCRWLSVSMHNHASQSCLASKLQSVES